MGERKRERERRWFVLKDRDATQTGGVKLK